MVSLLLEFGANPEASNDDGTTALAFAARQGRVEVARLLVERGACVNTVDVSEWCPLVHAAHAGYSNVVSYLATSCEWVVRSERDLGLEEAAQQALSAAALRGHDVVSCYFGPLVFILKQYTVDPLKCNESKLDMCSFRM